MNRQRPSTPQADPFSGSFSQARVETGTASWPVIQWHGGIAAVAANDRPARGQNGRASAAGQPVATHGGFFIDEERIADLGLDPEHPVPGFEQVTLRLGGRPISGWGAPRLQLAFIFADFNWEDRETGRLRFAAGEYDRRKRLAPGTERELRGRTRCLVGVRELLDEDVTEPLLLSVRGSYSASLNAILRDARRMADEATRLRRRAGYEGGVPREAFWIPVYRGPMEAVGEGANTSLVSLPKADVPAELARDFLIDHLVEEPHRRPGGTFDAWAEEYGPAWEERVVQGLTGPEGAPALPVEEDPFIVDA